MPHDRPMDNDRVIFARPDMETILHLLTAYPAEVSPEAVMARLAVVIRRKLGTEEVPPLADGQSLDDRFERFFDRCFDIEPLPAVPYMHSEFSGVLAAVAALIRKDRADDEDAELVASAEADARDYEAAAKEPTLNAAMKAYRGFDTYSREWMFAIGSPVDERRYYATLGMLDKLGF